MKNSCNFCQIKGEPPKEFKYTNGLEIVNGPWIGLSRYFDINGKPYLMATAEEDTERYYFKYCPECGRKIETKTKGGFEMENLIITDVYEEEQNVKIEGYSGHWSALEKTEYNGAVYFWYENNRYGDATYYLVGEWVDGILMRVFETYDGLEQCLIDEDII